MATVEEASRLICELCRLFYDQGWVSGTGGGISIKTPDKIVMAPSGVQKERLKPEDMFVLDCEGKIVKEPSKKPLCVKPPKLSECSPLFMAAYKHRGAGAVIHSHSVSAMLATVMDEESSEFAVTQLEMIKGIAGHGFYDNCTVPIIENTAREYDLTDRLSQAIKQYPKANAVLVRRHGVYVWGDSWIQAKTQAECYHFLFDAAVKMRLMGVIPKGISQPEADANGYQDAVRPAKRARLQPKQQRKIVVLDIEGTVSTLSFVADVMFPYALKNGKDYLTQKYNDAETQSDIQSIREQAAEDHTSGIGDILIPSKTAAPASVVSACCKWLEKATKDNRKVVALKTLQGHIWREGFSSGALVSSVFSDVVLALEKWRERGVKVYIYSSGSREAQRLFFSHTEAGDLRDYISGFFDTRVGQKFEPSSYEQIALTIGADDAGSIVFATDVLREAQAAQHAGWRPLLISRPGNMPITEQHNFKTAHSLMEIVDLDF